MLEKAAKILSILMILLMATDLVGAAINPFPCLEDTHVSVHQRSKTPTIASMLFGNSTEETEKDKDEEERNKVAGMALVDFSQIAVFLSAIHTPHVHFTPYEQCFHIRPPLFTLNCVFII